MIPCPTSLYLTKNDQHAGNFGQVCWRPLLWIKASSRSPSPQRRCGVSHVRGGEVSALLGAPLAGGARIDLKRADQEITAGPCFDELDLDVVHVVFEVKR